MYTLKYLNKINQVLLYTNSALNAIQEVLKKQVDFNFIITKKQQELYTPMLEHPPSQSDLVFRAKLDLREQH